MKILQINAINKNASTGRTCYEISEYLNQQEIFCTTAYSFGPHTEHSFCFSSKWGNKLHGLLSRMTGLQGYFSYLDTKKLIKYISDHQIDMVHIQNVHSNNIHLKTLLNFLAKQDIATVITLHDCWFYTGKCMHYTVQNCYRWQTGCHDCPQLRAGNKSWFFDRTPKMWSDKKKWFQAIPRLAVIGVSDWLTNEAKKSYLGDAKIVQRIYNWIDLDVFRPVDSSALRTQLDFDGKVVLLGVASGWSNLKGLDSMLELAKKLDDKYQLVLVGNLPNGIELPDNIYHIAATNDVDELVEYYSMADIFLQLSPEETFGKVVAEALACGTPVIAVDSTANSELVPTTCGMLVPIRDFDLLHQGIVALENRMDKMMQHTCRRYATEQFDKAACIDSYIQVYRRLMAGI